MYSTYTVQDINSVPSRFSVTNYLVNEWEGRDINAPPAWVKRNYYAFSSLYEYNPPSF